MKKILYVFIIISLFSCNDNPVQVPEKLLDEDVMVDILYDIALLQAADGYVPEKLASNNIKTNSFIYEKYKIDSLTYYQNHKYYAADIVLYKKMYKKVIDRIEQKTKDLEKVDTGNEELDKDSKAVYIPVQD